MTQSRFDQRSQRGWFGTRLGGQRDTGEGGYPPPAGGDIWALLNRERTAWFGWVPVIIGLGMAGYFLSPHEPSPWLAGLLVVAALIVARLASGRGLFGVISTVLLLLAVGFSCAKLRTEVVRAPVLERALGLVDVHGFIERVEANPKRGARLTLRPIAIEKLSKDQLPFRIRVRVLKTTEELHPGRAVRVRARLAPPPPPALPGGFDFARHSWFQQIGAVGYALSAPKIVPFEGTVPRSLRFAAGIERVRQHIAARMRAVVPGQSGAVAIALVTGERGGISEHTNQVYRDAGLFHILSISGMHMAIMAGAVFFIVRLGFAAIPMLALRYPIKKWAALIAALAALGYLALSGGAFATVRSYIMISVMFVAVLMDRPALALRNIALAAVIILVIYPESVLDPGFQMSFSAVAALVSVYEMIRTSRWGEVIAEFGPIRKAMTFFAGIVVSTVVAGLAVAPFAAYHFHTTQHLAVLANLIAMPVSNVVIMPAALAVLVLMPFGLEWPAAKLMALGIDVMTLTADWVAGLPGAVGNIATMPKSAFLLIVFGGLWLLLWTTRWRFGGIAAIAVGLALAPFGPRPDVLIGNKGKDVAVRGVDGQLRQLKPKRRKSFAVKRWLEADGQRSPTKSRDKRRRNSPGVPKGSGVCDAVGCVARVKGLTIAVAYHAGALKDDCRQADVVVFNAPRPEGCTAPRAVIDFFDIYYGGTHALYLDDPKRLRIVSVATSRGRRPWTTALKGRDHHKRKRPGLTKRSKKANPNTQHPRGDIQGKPSAPTTFDDDDITADKTDPGDDRNDP